MHKNYSLPNPIVNVRKPIVPQKEPIHFTLEQAKAIIENCRTTRQKALIHLQLGHGLRKTETCKIDVCDIGEDYISINGKKREEGFPILPETRELLLELAGRRKGNEPVFQSRTGVRLSTRRAYQIVKDVLKRAGVLENRADDERIGCHALRKTFSTLANRYGCDGRKVQKLLRHGVNDNTGKYLGSVFDDLKTNLDLYSPIRLVQNMGNGGNSPNRPYNPSHNYYSQQDVIERGAAHNSIYCV